MPFGPEDAPDKASDRDLVIAFQAGDRRAYDELYRRHMPRVRNVCHRLLGNTQDAEEAAQETFLKSFQALGRFNGQYQVGAWLSRIASNVCVDQLRSRNRHVQIVDLTERSHDELEDDAVEPDKIVTDKIEMASALQRIQPLHARALVLRTLKGLSHQEMAGELEMSPQQVKALLHRARTSFRRVWQNASGWAVAPLAGMKAALAPRTNEASEASLAVSISPLSGVVFERVAAGAVAAVLAFAGMHVSSEPVSNDPSRPNRNRAAPSESARPHALSDAHERLAEPDGAGQAGGTSGASGSEDEGKVVSGVLDELALAPEDEDQDEDGGSDGDDGPLTGGPTTTSKPVTDKVRETVEQVEDLVEAGLGDS